MGKMLKCLICGRLFQTESKNARYCSLSCAAEGRKRQRKTWEDKNPNYYRDYYKRTNKRLGKYTEFTS